MPEQKAWKVKALGEDRQYGGNRGYEDEIATVYRYDSFVANWRNVASGDLMLIEGKHQLQGMAVVRRLEQGPTQKLHRRCPSCTTTAIKERTTLSPKYRCEEGHEFEVPLETMDDCTAVDAYFEGSFVSTPGALTKEELQQACPRFADQLSIQELDIGMLATALRSHSPSADQLLRQFSRSQVLSNDEAASREDLEEYHLASADERDAAQRTIRVRRGQRRFRQQLRNRYGDQCMISGCPHMEVVQAAHIDPYRGPKANHVENGLLLRSDLHDLFDLDLLGIEPATCEVVLNHMVTEYSQYSALDGAKLILGGSKGPSRGALNLRWSEFQERLEKAD